MTSDRSPVASLPREEEPPGHVVEQAIGTSVCSPCRSKRGAVLFREVNFEAWGFNFKPQGFDCDGSVECKATCRSEAIHAEQMALLLAGSRAQGCDFLHVKTVDGKLVPSGGPSCVQCSKLALAVGVRGIWLYHESGWRWYDAPEWHRLSLAASTAHATEGAAEIARLTKDRDAWKETVFSADANAAQWCQRAEQAEAEIQRLRDQQGTVIAALKAARDTLVAFQNQAGYIAGQGYATTMTDAEMKCAQAVADLDSILAMVESPPERRPRK